MTTSRYQNTPQVTFAIASAQLTVLTVPPVAPRITFGFTKESQHWLYNAREMSTVKSPPEKKELSLKLDRRNTYGENSKASREAIPRGKQRQHMIERRSVGQALHGLRGNVHEDEAADAELTAKTRVTNSKRKGFKKEPDVPLGVVLIPRISGRRKRSAPTPLH